jgi:hypothetical protein
MKHPTKKPSDQVMRFFTPDLYTQFNSADDEVADRASEAWEIALQEYQRHLDAIRHKMLSQVRKVAELCLHDAEVLGFEQELQSFFPFPEPFWPCPLLSALAILSLKQDDRIYSLIYMLWDRVREYPAKKDWQFSKLRKHWLYDEVDVAADHRGFFLQRILFSDGIVVEIPFVSVITSSVTLPAADEGSVARRIA